MEKKERAQPPAQSCAFVAVIGAPNAGKSTLINQLVGSKVTIVSPKVQTTRTIVRGITIHDHCQTIFIDTPGIFQPKKRLERAIVAAAWEGQSDADMIVLVIDASRKTLGHDTENIIKTLSGRQNLPPCILVLNKIDKIKRERLLAMTADLNERLNFVATFMISAKTGSGTDDLMRFLIKNAPEGPWMYPEDQTSDMPMRMMAAEITREKLFHKLHQELPYALAVETESWDVYDNGDIKIGQTIFVARDAHKAIVLGKGGAMIKMIGEQARKELEDILGTRVHLKLHVKTREKWAEDPEQYRMWGLDYHA